MKGAREDYDAALAIYRAIQDRLGEANVLQARGDLKVWEDDLKGAREDYDEATQAPAQRLVGQPPTESANDATSLLQQEADLLRKLGELAEKRSDTQQAARYYEEALGLIRKSREPSTD